MYGYLIVQFEYRFTIYYTGESDGSGCEFDQIWDVPYRFDRKHGRLGVHQCFDFDAACETVLSGTSLGGICLWSVKEKQFLWSLQLKDPVSNLMTPVTSVYNANEDQRYVVYRQKTQTLCLVRYRHDPTREERLKKKNIEARSKKKQAKKSILS